MALRPASARTVEKARLALGARDQLELGRLLASEVDQHGANTADLAKLAYRTGCSVRTVHYAIGVYRLAQRFSLTPEQVTQLGWTKLAVVATSNSGIATKSDLLALCQDRTVTQIRGVLRGKTGAVKTVVFTLNKGQRAQLDDALVRFGATRYGGSIRDKERALMSILSKVA